MMSCRPLEKPLSPANSTFVFSTSKIKPWLRVFFFNFLPQRGILPRGGSATIEGVGFGERPFFSPARQPLYGLLFCSKFLATIIEDLASCELGQLYHTRKEGLKVSE